MLQVNIYQQNVQLQTIANAKNAPMENLAQTKISQMKNQALKDIKNTSVKIAVDSVKKILSTSVDQSKLDNLFDKNLEESKELLKKINS